MSKEGNGGKGDKGNKGNKGNKGEEFLTQMHAWAEPDESVKQKEAYGERKRSPQNHDLQPDYLEDEKEEKRQKQEKTLNALFRLTAES